VPQSGAPQAATDATASQASSKEWLPPAPPLPAADASAQPDDKQAGTEIAGASPPAPGGAQCDLAACSAAYFSFPASDCTYQPYQGPRRLCTRGGGTVATAAPRRHRAVGRVAQRFAGPPGARDQRELDEVTRIVRKMTRGERGDIAVQDSQGRIIIVHPGSARAYSPYDDYDGGD